MNLGISGSRDYNNFEIFEHVLLKFISDIQIYNVAIVKIVTGDANGVDKLARMFAQKWNIPLVVKAVNWNLGPKAGPLRKKRLFRKLHI